MSTKDTAETLLKLLDSMSNETLITTALLFQRMVELRTREEAKFRVTWNRQRDGKMAFRIGIRREDGTIEPSTTFEASVSR